MTAVTGPDTARGETERSQRWSQFTYWPLAIAAGVFLITYTVHVIGDVQGALGCRQRVDDRRHLAHVHRGLRREAAAFASASTLVPHPKFDLVLALIPALEPVRLLDAFTRLTTFTKTAGDSIRARLLIYGVGCALLLVWYISLMVLQFERNAPGSSITSFGAAVWWAFCTITTVGYGDYVPVTVPGRTGGGLPDGGRGGRSRPRRGDDLVVGRRASLARSR